MSPGLAPIALTPLEVASGLVFGLAPSEELPASTAGEAQTQREALERAILPALLRPPCLMSFSGGRGSTMILAIAVQLARREGLELPVPSTIRINGSAGADELVCQERVVIRLGLTEWLRLDFDQELDFVGPVATAALRRHGLLWPSDAHVWMPLIEWASGGSLITGIGDGNRVGDPPAVLSRDPRPLRWLKPSAQREVRARWTVDAVRRRRAERRQTGCWPRLRQVELGIEFLRRLGAERRVEVCHPLLDPAFSAAFAAVGNRFDADDPFVEQLLTAASANRRLPAPWAAALRGRFSRELAERWDGEDVNTELVDIRALKLEWSSARPDPRTSTLLQSLALARERRTVRALVRATGR